MFRVNHTLFSSSGWDAGLTGPERPDLQALKGYTAFGSSSWEQQHSAMRNPWEKKLQSVTGGEREEQDLAGVPIKRPISETN